MPFTRPLVILLGLLFASPALCAVPSESFYPLDEKLEGPPSQFRDVLVEISRNWPKGRSFCKYEKHPLKIQMVSLPTTGRKYYVGFKKCMGIKAPLSQVAAVMDDFDHYQDLFPGDKKVKVVARDKNKTTLAWERIIPVFFVPNEHYQMTHLAVTVSPKMKMYRSQLKQGGRLKNSDGLVVIEDQGPNLTLYSDYEFYEADYGVAFGIDAVGDKEIWKESLEGSFLSLLAIRTKAEHPDWSYEKVQKAGVEDIHSVDLNKALTIGSLKD